MSQKIPLTARASFAGLALAVAVSSFAQTVQRGPYLQMATPTALVVRWRTDQPTDSVVRYGTAPGNLSGSAVGASGAEHEVSLSGLAPETRYYYSIGTSGGPLAGDASYTFATPPPTGLARPTRVWVVGDSGEANAAARAVRDAYRDFTGARPTDLWLMLGDNAYADGTDLQYQAAVFDTYPEMLRQAPVWPTLGNHDGHSASSASQSGPYYDIFTLPRNAEAGGLASGTEAYYSFDRGNIHFVVLDSYDSDRSANGTMLTWLGNDLAASQQDWLIAFWHHPPYSKGSHNSDTEVELIDMRENALPLLESYGVDLVLSGHSHSYERSFLVDGHYGPSSTFSASMQLDAGSGRESDTGAYVKSAAGAMHQGAVYAVAGSSSKIQGGLLNHPVMFVSLNVLGSMVLDIDGLRLDARFLDDAGNERDHFTLRKDGGAPADTEAPGAPANLLATAATTDSVSLQWDAATDNVGIMGYRVSRGGQTVATVGTLSFTESGLQADTSYVYSVSAVDAAGNVSAVATVSATTLALTPPPFGSGGGSAVHPLVLAGLALLRRRRPVSRHTARSPTALTIWAGLALLLTLWTRPGSAHPDVEIQLARVSGAIASEPADASLYLLRGDLRRLHSDWAGAEADFSTAERLGAAGIRDELDLYRGRLHEQAGEPVRAIAELDRYVSRHPEHLEARRTRALAHAQTGALAAAIADYTRLIALDTARSPELWLERARLWLRAGQPDAALASIDEAIHVLGHLVTLVEFGVDTEIERQQYAAALRRMADLPTQLAQTPEWLWRRGQLLEQLDRSGDAARAYAQARQAISEMPARRQQTHAMQELLARLDGP